MALYDDDDRKKKQNDGPREKPSWREMDRKKDRGPHAPKDDRERPAAASPKAAWLEQRASKEALSTAEALFASPARDKALKALAAAADPQSVVAAYEGWRAQHEGLPTEPGALVALLKHPEPTVQVEAIEAIGQLAPTLTGPVKTTTLGALNLFRMSARSMDARKVARRVLKENGVTIT